MACSAGIGNRPGPCSNTCTGCRANDNNDPIRNNHPCTGCHTNNDNGPIHCANICSGYCTNDDNHPIYHTNSCCDRDHTTRSSCADEFNTGHRTEQAGHPPDEERIDREQGR